MRSKRKIARFLADLEPEAAEYVDPLAVGVIDSLGLEQLVAFVEDQYGVSFSDEDFAYENFASLDAFSSLVDAKRKGG